MQMFWFRLLRFLRCHVPFLELIEYTVCICLRCSWHIMTYIYIFFLKSFKSLHSNNVPAAGLLFWCRGFLLTSSSLRFWHIKYCLPSLHSCPFTMKQALSELSSIHLHQITSNSALVRVKDDFINRSMGRFCGVRSVLVCMNAQKNSKMRLTNVFLMHTQIFLVLN